MYLTVEKDNELVATRQEYSTPQKYNSAILIPVMLEVFKNHNLRPAQIDLIAINMGPGSFTGIRAGAVIARTLGQFLEVPVVGVPSLEIYSNACCSNKDKFIILDAKRSKWYTAHYTFDNKQLDEPRLQLNSDVLDFIEKSNVQIVTEKSLTNLLNTFSPIFFEDLTSDFGVILTGLAKEKVATSHNYKEEFAWYNLKPVYLQTPSITMPKKSISSNKFQ